MEIGLVVFELKWGRKWKFVPNLDDIRLFGILAFWNRLEYHNFDFSRL